MGGCRVPGPTCRERGTGVAGRETGVGGTTPAQPTGAGHATPSGPTLSGWPRQIAWSEFQDVSERPVGEREDAQIKSDLSQPDQVAVARENGQFKLAAYAATLSVTRSESWVVTSAKSAQLLAHEQGHYDITGLGARDMVADLGLLRARTTDRLQRDVQNTIQRAQELADRLTQSYDTDTNHGLKRDRQQKWEQLIASCKQNGTRLTAGPS